MDLRSIIINFGSNYEGQTKKSFSTRWTAKRNKFKLELNSEDVSDESAFYRHYFYNQKNILENFNINCAYKVASLEQLSLGDLNQGFSNFFFQMAPFREIKNLRPP